LLKLLTDENLKRQILIGLRRRVASVDAVRVQDAGLSGAEDPDILAWAAAEGRVLLTHDAQTVPDFAYQRLREGDRMPGVVIVPDQMAIGRAIDDLVLMLEAGSQHDLEHQILYLPL
jgi:predicted nuclease of predicted toxin-antitoxin system